MAGSEFVSGAPAPTAPASFGELAPPPREPTSGLHPTFEQASIGIARQTLDEEWIAVNERFCQILGYPREELLRLRLEDITHPADVAATREFAQRAREGTLREHAIEKRYIRKDGSIVWTQLTVTIVLSRTEAPSYFVGFLEDITPRKRAEQRLAAQYAVSRILGEATMDAEIARPVLDAVCEALEWDTGTLWIVDAQADVLRCAECAQGTMAPGERRAGRSGTLRRGEGLPGRVWSSGVPEWLDDMNAHPDCRFSTAAVDDGYRGALAFPITSGNAVLGVMSFYSASPRPADADVMESTAVLGGEVGQFLERQRGAQRLHLSEVQKAAIVDAALDCIVSIDAQGRITEFNPAAERTFGWARADVLGKPMVDVIMPPSMRARHEEGFGRAIATGRMQRPGGRLVTTARRADGSEFPIEVTVAPTPVPGGAAFTAFLRDVTDRVAAETAQRESEERFRLLTEAMSDGVLIHDQGTILDANQSLLRTLGYELEEVIGQNAFPLIIAPDHHASARQHMVAGHQQPYEIVGLRKDGTRLDFEITGRHTTFHGRPVRVVAIRDITERKQLAARELQLVREHAARVEAEAAQRRAAFLAEASRLLGASFDYQTTLATLARLAVPVLADYCIVDVREGGRFARMGLAHADPAKMPLLQRLEPVSFETGSAEHPTLRAVVEGRSVVVRDVTPALIAASVATEEHRRYIAEMHPVSLMAVPLRSSDHVVGVITFVAAESGRRFGADDLALAEELAHRAALAVWDPLESTCRHASLSIL